MKNQNNQYHIKIEKHILFAAVTLGILVSGLLLTLTEVGQVQTLAQHAQTVDTVTVATTVTDTAIAEDPAKHDACPIGGGLPPVKCAPDYICNYNSDTKVGNCIPKGGAPGTGATGTAGPTNNTNCTPGNDPTGKPIAGIVCDVKAGYTCQKGFCIRNAPGIPTQSSATGGALSGPAAGSGGSLTGAAGGTKPVAGSVCTGLTKLSPEEARILNGMCPDVDPGKPGANVCKDFCAATPDDPKCKKGGYYHCETPNKGSGTSIGKCVTGGGKDPCTSGTAQGVCGPTEGTCCKIPPPPPPPPPPPLAPAGGNKGPAAPVKARAGGAAPAGAVATCQKTCKAPNKCNSKGVCYKPVTGGAPANACKTLNQPCGPNSVCRIFGSGGINSNTLSCQQGGRQVTATGPNGGSIQVLTNPLGANAPCRNSTECSHSPINLSCKANTAAGAPKVPASGSYTCQP